MPSSTYDTIVTDIWLFCTMHGTTLLCTFKLQVWLLCNRYCLLHYCADYGHEQHPSEQLQQHPHHSPHDGVQAAFEHGLQQINEAKHVECHEAALMKLSTPS